MGARVRAVAPKTLMPAGAERLGIEVFDDMNAGLADCDIVMMLRLQTERMYSAYFPSLREISATTASTGTSWRQPSPTPW